MFPFAGWAEVHWLVLILLCAFSLATADAFTKKLFPGCNEWQLVLLRFLVPGLLLAPVLFAQPWPELPPGFWGWVAVLVPLELAAMAMYVRAIRGSPLAHTLPYLAFTPVFSTLVAWPLLGEIPGPRGAIGILLVTLGAYLLNIAGDRSGRGRIRDPLVAMLKEPGARLMLGVAMLYGITSVLGKAAMAYTGATFFGPFYFGLLGLMVLAATVLARPRNLTIFRRAPGASLLVGGAMAVMVITHFLALQHAPVAYVIAVKRSSLLFGIVYGALLFGEPRFRQNFLAGSIMLLGVVLIAVE